MLLPAKIRVAFAVALAFALSACGINSVPTAEENAKARWADVQSAYQRRADLVPNLVNTVRAAAESEEGILTQVIEARSRASSIQLDADDLSDPAQFQAFENAQGELGSALSRLMVVVEQYPQLQSQGRFADLMTQLEGTENRIDVARTRYNEAVQDYNTTIRTFPATIAANIVYGAEPMQPFTAQPGSEIAPEVDFGDMGSGSTPARPAAPANDDLRDEPAAATN